VTDDRERDEAREPRIRITDRRRFASMTEEGDAPVSTEETGAVPVADDAQGAPGSVAGDLAAAQADAAQYLDHLRRLQAEFDNYRKRVQRELGEAQDLGAAPVVRRMLEVLDDFELALIHATEKPDFDRFLHGVELVYAKLVDGLKAEGLERMEPEGQPFDPELHEALMQTGEGDEEPVVIDVLRPGYTLRGRVLRPAGVRVERGVSGEAPATPGN
jgi:molecular chaperone GrpE